MLYFVVKVQNLLCSLLIGGINFDFDLIDGFVEVRNDTRWQKLINDNKLW